MSNGHFIAGESLLPAQEAAIEVRSPWSSDVVGTVPRGGPSSVEAALESCAAATKTWRRVPLEARLEHLIALRDRIDQGRDELAKLLVAEVGKPLKGARLEVSRLIDAFDYFAAEAPLRLGEVEEGDEPTLQIVRDPVGVVVAILPFNFPVQLMSWKLLPAMLTGCATVVKPDPRTPLSTGLLAQWAHEVGWPPGVFNVVHGDADTGAALVADERVAKVAFTGSVRGGRAVYRSAADGIKRVTLELGGCGPLIVWKDADIEGRIDHVRSRSFYNAGQYCFRINRAYVHRSRYEELIERFVASASQLQVGDPSLETTDIGPLIDRDALQRVVANIEDAERAGARVALDGRAHMQAERTVIGPTLLADVPATARVMCGETFGPVVSIAPVDELDEAIERANGTEYGLSAFALAGDPEVARALRERLEAGSVWVNALDRASMAAPFGGIKHSGLGVEKSRWAFNEYLQPRAIYCDER